MQLESNKRMSESSHGVSSSNGKGTTFFFDEDENEGDERCEADF